MLTRGISDAAWHRTVGHRSRSPGGWTTATTNGRRRRVPSTANRSPPSSCGGSDADKGWAGHVAKTQFHEKAEQLLVADSTVFTGFWPCVAGSSLAIAIMQQSGFAALSMPHGRVR